MCNEYSHDKDKAEIKRKEKIQVYGCVPKEDIRITDEGSIIIVEDDTLCLKQLAWGWVVPWNKKPLNNAKSETLTTLPTFKRHLDTRCLILADGFYEKKIRFVQEGERGFCIAGLWRQEKDAARYTMLTTTPNETVAPYHHRMPFILRADQCEAWLEGDWQDVLKNPDKSPLQKIVKQPDLFL